MVYVDTALFIKTYVFEHDSEETVRLLDEIGEPFLFSDLHSLEIPNAIRLKRFRGEITPKQEALALEAFHVDIEAGRFCPAPAENRTIFRRAEVISSMHSARTGARSLDIWHVAAALESGCDSFVSYDTRQRTVAKDCGLKLLPPEPVPGNKTS